MGNVLDCSSDPLDQIHEGSDGDITTEVSDAEADSRKKGPARVDGDRGTEDSSDPQQQQKLPIVYLERAVPLRDSIMWKLQREYYTAHHVKCWEKMVVPCFVTSNSFIARAYARVLVGFMRDWFLFNDDPAAGRSSQKPMVIIEVGSGHGKFSYLVLKHLLEMREFLPTLPSTPTPAPAPAARTTEDSSKNQNSRTSSSSSGDNDNNNAEPSSHGEPKQENEGEAGYKATTGEGGAFDVTAAAANDGDDLGRQGESEIVTSTPLSATNEPAPGQEAGGVAVPGGGNEREEGVGITREKKGAPRTWDGLTRGEFDGLPFRYVVTDVAQGTLDYVRSHPSMQIFLENGLLELALLDAEDPDPPGTLHMQVSDTTADLETWPTPVAAVCNYVFDSLQQDAFRIKDDILYENRVSITAARPLPDDLSQLSLNALEGLGLQWEHVPHAVAKDRASHFYAGLGTQRSDKQSSQATSTTTSPAAREENNAADRVALEAAAVSSKGSDAGKLEDGDTTPLPYSTEDASVSPTNAPKNGPEDDVGGDLGGNEEAAPTASGDADFDATLASYLGSFGREGGSLLMPLGGLRLLRRLSSLAGGRCLILTGDKGYVREEEMSGQRDPHIAYHGSLSCMVNLDALARYTRQRGGWALASPYMEGFKCQALAFGMEEKEGLEEMRLAFEGVTQEFGPESFSTLQRAVKDEVAQPSLWLVMQLLRLSRLDPDVFMKFRAAVVQQVSNHDLAPPGWEDLKNDALAIADTWYPLQQGKDVNFEVARLLMALKDFESAVLLFRRSGSVCGEHNVTCHNMGMSYFYLGKLKQAKACFERSLDLNETYDDSLQWLAHVNQALEPPSATAAPREPGTVVNRTSVRIERSVSSERPPAVLDPAGLGLGRLSI